MEIDSATMPVPWGGFVGRTIGDRRLIDAVVLNRRELNESDGEWAAHMARRVDRSIVVVLLDPVTQIEKKYGLDVTGSGRVFVGAVEGL